MVNTSYYSGIVAKINDAKTCEEIQAYADEASAAVNDALAEIGKQLEKLAPILALLSPPGADPGAIVGYLTGLITGLIGPISKPAFEYPTMIISLMSELTNINSAIQAKIAALSASLESQGLAPCSITLPTATPPDLPPGITFPDP